jgi:DNA-binding FadR family transcriptional regulator
MQEEPTLLKNIKETKTMSLAEQAAEQINQLIIDRDFKPGDKIPNEFEIAKSLNVGRPTVREAVKLLVARNCLEIRRGVGTFVVERVGQIKDPLGFAYVQNRPLLARELLEVRLELEPWCAALAAERILEEEKEELRKLCRQVEVTIESGEDHYESDKAFHAYISQCTHNSVLMELVPIVGYGIQMFTKFKQQEMLDGTIDTHREITNAICANDPEKARECMYKHVIGNKEHIMKMEQGES